MNEQAPVRYILDNQPRSGWFNMAADDYLSQSIRSQAYQAILRFYTWSPPAVSLGIHQSKDAVSHAACRGKSWDIVFRPTGGRTLLHLHDISYSIIISNSQSKFSNLKSIYNGIADALVNTLKGFGINADNTRNTSTRNKSEDSRNGALSQSRLCLGTRVRGEVHYNQKKVAAAAQRLYRESVLQHGSIILKGDPSEIVDVIQAEDNGREVMRNLLREKAASIEALYGEEVNLDHFISLFTEEICSAFNLKRCDDTWTDRELHEINAKKDEFRILQVLPEDNPVKDPEKIIYE